MSSLKLPQLIGHRGCGSYAVENTLQSIHTAADMGIDWVALDIKITKDGVPILFHDDDVNRMTNGDGQVSALTLQEIKDLELVDIFSEQYSGLTIPTLEEALDVLIDRGMGVNFEIKPYPGKEVETAEAMLDLLSYSWDEHNKIILSSFSHVSLETCFDLTPIWARGLLLSGEEWPENWKDIAKHLDVSSLHIDGNTASDDQVVDAISTNTPIVAYTINDSMRAQSLQRLGVRSFISDEPDTLQDSILTVH